MIIRGQVVCADCGKPSSPDHSCPESRARARIEQLEATIADLRKQIASLVSPEVYPESLGTVYFMTKFGLAVYPLQSEIRIIPKGYALSCPPNGPVTMEKIEVVK